MNPLYRQFLATIIRGLLAGLGGALVARGWFTGEEIKQYIDVFAAGAATFIVAIGWGLVNRAWDRWKYLLAIEAPSNTPEKVIDQKFAKGEKPQTALREKADNIPSTVNRS